MTKTVSTCNRDGFPLVMINGKEQCVAEYLDRCIGSKKIVDVVLHENALTYVFENGHELPLFCFCCDEPLACKDLSEYQKGIIGRKLEAMVWDIEKYDDGKEAISFGLELTMLKGETEPPIIATSLKSTQKMIHPSTCGYRERSSTDTRKKSRKPRSRGRRKSKSSPSQNE